MWRERYSGWYPTRRHTLWAHRSTSQAAFSRLPMQVTQGFAPILGPVARVLILGTLPSQQSLKRNQYFGHPRNAFWPIMGELFGAGPELPYAKRTQLLQHHEIAVWDVLRSARRAGSMDAAIEKKDASPNNFAALHAAHPELELVCFNGQAAARLFKRLVPPDVQESFGSVRFVTMPSTSPALAAMSFADKLSCWSKIATGRTYRS